MKTDTKTRQIFNLTAPYSNPYQGTATRLLFVCSVGLLRSPTCADVATSMGYNSRSCGSCIPYALIPLSANLIYWSEKIIFVNKENYIEALQRFEEHEDCIQLLKSKSICWNIEDDYVKDDPWLINIAKEKLSELKF